MARLDQLDEDAACCFGVKECDFMPARADTRGFVDQLHAEGFEKEERVFDPFDLDSDVVKAWASFFQELGEAVVSFGLDQLDARCVLFADGKKHGFRLLRGDDFTHGGL